MAPITRSKIKSGEAELHFESLTFTPQKRIKKVRRKSSDRCNDVMSRVEELQCSICSFIFQVPFSLSPCKHTFCKDCIGEWMTRQLTCPLCRREPLNFNHNIKAEKEINMLAASLSEALQDDLGFKPDDECRSKIRVGPELIDGMTIADFKDKLPPVEKPLPIDSTSNVPTDHQVPSSSNFSNANRSPAQSSHARRVQYDRRNRFPNRSSNRYQQNHHSNQYGAFINGMNGYHFGAAPDVPLPTNFHTFAPTVWNAMASQISQTGSVRHPASNADPFGILNATYTAINPFSAQPQPDLRHHVNTFGANPSIFNLMPNQVISAPRLHSFAQRSAPQTSAPPNSFISPSQHSQFTNNARLCINPTAPQVFPAMTFLSSSVAPPATSTSSHFWTNTLRGVNLFRPLASNSGLGAPPNVLADAVSSSARPFDLTQFHLNQSQLFVHYFS